MACVRKRRGRYVLDFYDHTGKRVWETMPKGTTKKEAETTMRARQDALEKGVYLAGKKAPLFSDVAKAWLEHKKANVRDSTWQMYRGHLEHHFGIVWDVKINRVSPALVEKYIAEKQGQGMNLTTLRKTLVTFNQVMAFAVRHRFIDHNPVRDAEKPRDQGKPQEAKVRILSPGEIQAFLDNVESPKHRTLFMLAIMTGARQGELLGLKWTDVDWFNSQIHIQRTFNKGEWYKPKSIKSDRRVDLGPQMLSELKIWLMACPKTDLDLVFPNENGNPIDQAYLLRRYFFPALKKAGAPRVRFHDLRHTYASLLIEQGENVKYIQNQLGHSSPTVTLNVYAHLMNPTNQESACRLENTLFGTNGSKTVAGNKKGATTIAVTP